MSIDLYKLINKLDDVKIEVGAYGGRTLTFEGTRFKMNELVKRLIKEKLPLTPTSLKKIEKLNHALPEKLNFIQKILTIVRQFFGNLAYNRDRDLFSYSFLCAQVVSDTKPKFIKAQIEETPLTPISLSNGHDEPKKSLTPLSSLNPLHLVIVPKTKKVKITKEEPKKPEKKEVLPTPAAAPIEPPATEAKPKLTRSKSFNSSAILSTLKEKCEIEDINLLVFAKEIQANLDVRDKDYPIKLNSVVQELCGEPLFKFERIDNRDVRVEIAFNRPDCIKILQYTVIRLLTSDIMNYPAKSRLLENLAPYFPIAILKEVFEAYIRYIVEKKGYYPDKLDESLKFMLIRYYELCKKDPACASAINKELIALGIGCTILKDVKEAGWVEDTVNRYKKDKEFLTHLDSFLQTHLKPNERRAILNVIAEYLKDA